MKSRYDTMQEQLNTLLSREENYVFTDFLEKIRKTLRYTRREVREITGVSVNRIFRLEKGVFSHCPQLIHLKTLSILYGVSFELLQRKLATYLLSDSYLARFSSGVLSAGSKPNFRRICVS